MNLTARAFYAVIILLLSTAFFSFTNDMEKNEKKIYTGIASYYHNKFNGRKTANGEIFSNAKFTAANNFLRLGTIVKVLNPQNGKTVVVKINDRMNKANKRLIDLSHAAAHKLGLTHQGIGEVHMEIIDFENNVDNINSIVVIR